MTLRHPLHVSGAAAGVTAPQDARLAMAGILSGPGLLSGGVVAGSTSGPNMQYTIAAGCFITQRGTLAADGLYILPNDGPITANSAAPAPSSGSRYDVIWVRSKNAFGSDGFGDANSDPDFGVAVGTASATPTVPAVPSGALALATALVGTSIANASLATITQVAPLTGVDNGILQVPTSTRYPAAPVVGQYIDDATLGLLRWDGSAWQPYGKGGDTGWAACGSGNVNVTGTAEVRRIGNQVFGQFALVCAGGWPTSQITGFTLPNSSYAPVGAHRMSMGGAIQATPGTIILSCAAGSTTVFAGSNGTAGSAGLNWCGPLWLVN